jgi:hypothetical protein
MEVGQGPNWGRSTEEKTCCLQRGAVRKHKFADVKLFPVKLVDH